MGYLLAGLAFLALLILLSQGFVRTKPSTLARVIRGAGGFVALAVATVLAVRGAFAYAAPLAGFAVWLLNDAFSGGGPGVQTSSGNASKVRTATLDMELDLATGTVRGEVIRGPYAGRDIEDLTPAQLADLWAECNFSDPQSAQIIEAYLDREHPDWRKYAGAGPGPDDGGQQAAGGGPMSVSDARDILGVGPNATRDEIIKAHREKMLENHPDRGGSTDMAARINEAKDVLLKGS
jgi:hypothetical protein